MMDTRERIEQIEDEVDNFLFNKLDENIPRYKFIYHMNLVYIDYVLENKLLFSMAEKHFLYSLSYNTFLAYKKLSEEEVTDFTFDYRLYKYCLYFLTQGMQYSILCDMFPALHSKKAEAIVDERSDVILVKEESPPRKYHDFISKYTIRKTLSYTLQMVSGILNDKSGEEATWELTKQYMNFWNENMLHDDFEPYSVKDWAGVTLFFTLTAMRRFTKLYRADFNIHKISPVEMMVVLSPEKRKEISGYTISNDLDMTEVILNDFIYKPIGNGLFPKSNISDAPLIQTKDGYIFTNPFVFLFNDSNETRLLNNLRKYDNARYQRIKDKLKERAIPIIESLVKIKYPEACIITNFYLPIPNKRKKKRELDILIIDKDTGFVLYVEIKHFFNPISYSETKSLDAQFQEALNKTSDQLHAIEANWDLIKERCGIETKINSKKAIIVSHHYLGRDVEIHEEVPIVDISTFYESISDSNTVEELYLVNKEIDDLYSNINIKSREVILNYAGYKFSREFEYLDPRYEIELINSLKRFTLQDIDLTSDKGYQNVEEYAKALLDKLQAKK
ncbi:hypothetical protein BTJ45_01139 [Bacillus mycoides]|nr:hypothetical protein BTJ45_01139 [Bacillus mycoides]